MSDEGNGESGGPTARPPADDRELSGIEKRESGALNMQRNSFTTTAITILAAMVLLLWSAESFAGTPTLGPDCGAGASITGSDSAGKVTLGTSPSSCTLTFGVPYPNAPACEATNETNGGGYSLAVGTKTTVSTLDLNSSMSWSAGDVISYLCQDY